MKTRQIIPTPATTRGRGRRPGAAPPSPSTRSHWGDPADPDDPVPSCLSQLTLLRLVATPSTVQSGSSTTLSYSVRIPKDAAG